MSILECVLIGLCCYVVGFLVGKKLTKYDGRFIMKTGEDGYDQWLLDLDYEPEELEHKKEVRFKVFSK